MPEALKDRYDREFIESLAKELGKQKTRFPQKKFISQIFDTEWKQKELKQRMSHITICIHQNLAMDFSDAAKIIVETSSQFDGFLSMFFPEYIERYGQDNWDLSMWALEKITPFASSEFAIRPFIKAQFEPTIERMKLWSKSDCEHVRRLASEGSRPRLPWAMALPMLKKDPSPVFPILERLKVDPSEYVRRSVANHLNDISKDNPQQALKLASQWKALNDPKVNWVCKHACRTLLKAGEIEALRLFGYEAPTSITLCDFQFDKETLKIGEELHFSFRLKTSKKQLGKIRVEYIVGYQKARKKCSKKVFMISEVEQKTSEKSFERKRSFKDLSTRKHYPGTHTLEVKVNGVVLGSQSFTLTS